RRADARRLRPGHGELPGAGAVPAGAARRRGERPVQPRRDAVRGADGAAAVPAGDGRTDAAAARLRPARRHAPLRRARAARAGAAGGAAAGAAAGGAAQGGGGGAAADRAGDRGAAAPGGLVPVRETSDALGGILSRPFGGSVPHQDADGPRKHGTPSTTRPRST